MQTHLTNLLKRLDLELEQKVQIGWDKKDQKTCCRRGDVALPLMRLVINWNIDYNQYNLNDSSCPQFADVQTSPFICFCNKNMSQCYGWVLKGRRGKRVKNGVWTRFSYKMIPWLNFRFTLPLVPKRKHFLNSIWWTDRAMSIYLHQSLPITSSRLDLFLRAAWIVQIKFSVLKLG